MNDFDRNIHCLFGIPIDALDMRRAEQQVRAVITTRTPCFLSTPNLNFLIACQTDADFRASLIHSDLCIADGMPLVWIARLLGIPIRERVAGSDLFEALRGAESPPVSVYFFGGKPGVAEAASHRVNQRPEGLRCVGYETPAFGPIHEISSEETIAKINASGADFLVVALGAKKGQAWIERNRARITVPLISHLGAVLNFTAGTVRRAPRGMQRVGLEWVWRIVAERNLWRRYCNDCWALLRLLATRVLPYAFYVKVQAPNQADLGTAALKLTTRAHGSVLHCQGAWSAQNIDRLRPLFKNIAASAGDIELDMEQVTHVDSAFIGLTMMLYKHQQRLGKRFVISGMSTRVERIFRWNGAAFLCAPPTPMGLPEIQWESI